MFKRVIKTLDEKLEPFLIVVLTITFVIIVLMEVFRRYVLHNPSSWSDETARYIFIYVVYLAAAWAIKSGSHIKMDIIMSFVNEKWKFILRTFGNLVFALCAVTIIANSIPVIDLHFQMGNLAESRALAELNFNLGYAYIALPLGWGLVLIRLIQSQIIMYKKYKLGTVIGEEEVVRVD